MRLARHLAIAHQLIGLAHQKHRRKRAGGTVTRERYAVLVFEREAPLRGGQGVRLTVGASWPGTRHLTWRFDVPMESSMR
jgi:hypothetical protein